MGPKKKKRHYKLSEAVVKITADSDSGSEFECSDLESDSDLMSETEPQAQVQTTRRVAPVTVLLLVPVPDLRDHRDKGVPQVVTPQCLR